MCTSVYYFYVTHCVAIVADRWFLRKKHWCFVQISHTYRSWIFLRRSIRTFFLHLEWISTNMLSICIIWLEIWNLHTRVTQGFSFLSIWKIIAVFTSVLKWKWRHHGRIGSNVCKLLIPLITVIGNIINKI